MAESVPRSDRIISRIKDHPVAAIATVVGAIVIGLGAFTNAITTIVNGVRVDRPGEARAELSRMSLDFTADAFIDAASTNDLRAVELYLAAGMAPNVSDPISDTPLRAAVRNGHPGIVDTLVQADAEYDDYELYWAVQNSDPEILGILLKGGPSIAHMNSAFVGAAAFGHLEHMRLMLASGVQARTIGSDALRAAAGDGASPSRETDAAQAEIVAFLLGLGADVNARDESGMSALNYAARSGFVHVVRQLLAHGAAMYPRTVGGEARGLTPLMVTLIMVNGYPRDDESERITEMLLSHGADVNARNAQGRTPLSLAANFRTPRTVQALLDAGALVNETDDRGRTALSYTEFNRPDGEQIARLLRKADAQ
jgi:ankyrin repeat protein